MDRGPRSAGGSDRDRREGPYRRDGGGYNRGRNDRGGEPSPYQRSFVGNKRGREEAPPEDPARALVLRLLSLGDGFGAQGGPRASDVVGAAEDVVVACLRDVKNATQSEDEMVELLFECVTELPIKTPVYVLLIGLINQKNPGLGTQFIAKAAAQLSAAIASPDVDAHDTARRLLRTLACLPAVQMLHATAVTALLEQVASAALRAARQADDTLGHTWQPWADWLMYIALAALPWAGAGLVAAAPTELGRLLEVADEYMNLRPLAVDLELCPFMEALKEGDIAAASDSGGASFLPQLWSAIQACATSTPSWKVEAVPQPLAHEALAQRLADITPHELPAVIVPTTPPAAIDESAPAANGDEATAAATALRAAYIRKCFPPRGGIRLLPSEHTEGARPMVERFVAEEYILDTLLTFASDRKACVRALTAGLPLRFPYGPLLCETLFGQMLALPASRLPPLAYSTVLVELCKAQHLEMPRAMSGCVRECFARLGGADPSVPPRLLAFLSYHLSSFELQWPWQRWEQHLEAARTSPQRQFCVQLLARLARLTYWDRVTQLLPPKFAAALGSPPKPPLLPGEPGGPAPPEAPPAAAPMDGLEGAALDKGRNGNGHGNGDLPVTDVLAGEALARVRAKASSEALVAWVAERGVEAAAGLGPLGPLVVLMRALLSAGAKSASHLVVALERYASALSTLAAGCPDGPAAQRHLLSLAAQFYAASPEKVQMITDRLLALGLVSPSVAAAWVADTQLPSALSSRYGPADAVDLLGYCLDRAAAAAGEAAEKAGVVGQEEAACRVRAAGLAEQGAALLAQMKAQLASGAAAAAAAAAAKADGEGGDGGPPAAMETEEGSAGLRDPAVEEAAKADPRAWRLLVAARDYDDRARAQLSKADGLAVKTQELQATIPGLVDQSEAAVLATYRAFASLISRQEDAADDIADDSSDAARELGQLYHHLAAFARRTALQATRAGLRLQTELDGVRVTPRFAETVRQVLHAELLRPTM